MNATIRNALIGIVVASAAAVPIAITCNGCASAQKVVKTAGDVVCLELVTLEQFTVMVLVGQSVDQKVVEGVHVAFAALRVLCETAERAVPVPKDAGVADGG